jgi:hypothetical protein
LISACLFGDGAGAAVLSRQPGPSGRRIEWKDSTSLVESGERNALMFEQRDGMLRNILNVHEIAGSGPGHLVADAYFKAQATAPLSRHHALCDARALRLAYEAGVRASLSLDQPSMVFE